MLTQSGVKGEVARSSSGDSWPCSRSCGCGGEAEEAGEALAARTLSRGRFWDDRQSRGRRFLSGGFSEDKDGVMGGKS